MKADVFDHLKKTPYWAEGPMGTETKAYTIPYGADAVTVAFTQASSSLFSGRAGLSVTSSPFLAGLLLLSFNRPWKSFLELSLREIENFCRPSPLTPLLSDQEEWQSESLIIDAFKGELALSVLLDSLGPTPELQANNREDLFVAMDHFLKQTAFMGRGLFSITELYTKNDELQCLFSAKNEILDQIFPHALGEFFSKVIQPHQTFVSFSK